MKSIFILKPVQKQVCELNKTSNILVKCILFKIFMFTGCNRHWRLPFCILHTPVVWKSMASLFSTYLSAAYTSCHTSSHLIYWIILKDYYCSQGKSVFMKKIRVCGTERDLFCERGHHQWLGSVLRSNTWTYHVAGKLTPFPCPDQILGSNSTDEEISGNYGLTGSH